MLTLVLLLEGINIHFEKLNLNVDEAVKEYSGYVKDWLCKLNAEIPEYKELFLKEVVRRSNERIKPISGKGEEFRDTILWLTILDYLKKERFDEAVFISNNTRDFADVTQTSLHQQLQDDLESQDSTLTYYKSLNDFIDRRVNELIFISNEWLVDHLDWEKLDRKAIEVVNSIYGEFFYQYYYRSKFDENDIESWEILLANFYQCIPMYCVDILSEPNSFTLAIFLNGISTIRFVNDKCEQIDRNVDFSTTLRLDIKEGRIIRYKGFSEDESGLSLPD